MLLHTGMACMTSWSVAGGALGETTAADSGSTMVYQSSFEVAGDAARWEGGRLHRSTSRLGQFGNEATTLKLTDLPRHEAVRVRVRLVIEGDWTGETFAHADGNVIGPDQWGLRLVGAATVIHTTFSNHDDHAQAFPRSWRQATSPARSGAAASSDADQRSSTYELDYTLRHDAASIAIRMYGIGLGARETWSVDSVRIDVLDKLPAPADTSAEAIDELIERLHEGNAEASEAAAWMLARTGVPAISPLIESLKHHRSEVMSADDRLAMVKQLDAASFADREAATEKLKALSTDDKRSLKAITDRMELTVEQQWRLDDVFRSMSDDASGHRAMPPAPTSREQHDDRVVRVLELMHAPDAARAARAAKVATAFDRLRPGVVFTGVCGQDSYPSYPLHLEIDRLADGEMHGRFHWKTLRDTRSKFKGTHDDNRLVFTEYEVITGGGIVIPVDYQAVLVGQMVTGVWSSDGTTTAFYGRLSPR